MYNFRCDWDKVINDLYEGNEVHYYDTEGHEEFNKLHMIGRGFGKTETIQNYLSELMKYDTKCFFMDSLASIDEPVKVPPLPLYKLKHSVDINEPRDLSNAQTLLLRLLNTEFNQRTLIEDIGVYLTNHDGRFITLEFNGSKLMTDLKVPESFNEMVDKLNEYINENSSHK